MGIGVVDPLIGQLVDERYQVTVRIARGGMATVYRAVDRRLDREVALKVMHPHLTEGADFVARFRREARAAARLVHPGVVSVFDQGTAGESPYLVMEFIDGPNLRAHLRAVGSLSLGDALSVIAQVLNALSLAHAQGLVHRDIKPENVLIAPGGRIKVADFGLARAMSEVTMATSGVVLGTAAYLSPEVVQRGFADARSDVYACGIMLYELVTATKPFDGDNTLQVAYQHVSQDVPAPSLLLPWLPPEVDRLVQAMTSRDPAGRPADAGAALEMVRQVRQALTPEQLEQKASTAAPLDPALIEDEAEEFIADVEGLFAAADNTEVLSRDDIQAALGRGSTVALPVGAASLLGDADGGPISPASPQAASGQRPGPSQPRRRHRLRRRYRWAIAAAGLAVLAGLGGIWYFLAGPGSMTSVPAVTGMTEQSAVDRVKEQGLNPQIRRAYDDHVGNGEVVSADPAAGQPVKKDGTVTLVISRGIEMRTVPKVAGMTEAEAISALKQAGLANGHTTAAFSGKYSSGFVISSDPKAGVTVPHTKTVGLVVSKGPEPVEMPKIEGRGTKKADAALKKLSLTATVTHQNSKTVPAGVIISQSPSAGTELKRGDQVAYVVSDGPRMVTVPSVLNTDAGQATTQLQQAGFLVARQTPQKIAPLNRVYEQSPAAGTQAPEGSTVTISVF